MTTTVVRAGTSPPKATFGETLGVFAGVIVPTLAKGVIIRRPLMVALAEKLDLDRHAVRRVQRLRDKYGVGPLRLRTPPMWPRALILSPDHVHHVLDNSPEPFATASSEKRAALAHFQPRGVLISHGPERADRRRFNEAVLDADRPLHRLADRFVAVVNEEADELRSSARQRGELVWNDFANTWFRVVRRVVFGDAARDDHELRQLIDALRSDANWAFLKLRRDDLRHRFYARLDEHLARAEPGSLAHVMTQTRVTDMTEPQQQVPQWLFAFDPAGMTTFRALALLATHPAHAERARAEMNDDSTRRELPYLRACVLESLRLWPTTPMVLRETTAPTTWETGELRANTGILIFANFFHRDDQRLPYADRFTPEIWLEHRTNQHWPLIPFSGGPAICPGRNLVLLTSSSMLAALLRDHRLRLTSPQSLDPQRPLPYTLNNYALRFAIAD